MTFYFIEVFSGKEKHLKTKETVIPVKGSSKTNAPSHTTELGPSPKMKVLLTGGSSNLGHCLARPLTEGGDQLVNIDIRPQLHSHGRFVHGSILDRKLLDENVKSCDAIVHIAAWHGIHEHRAEKTPEEFWDLNVNGTWNLFRAAHNAGVKNIVHISSTSVLKEKGVYGFTKRLSEDIADRFASEKRMNVITLRPRAFIPHWDRHAYKNYIEWAAWFWRGAVHITDVAQAVQCCLHRFRDGLQKPHLKLVVDGAYDYTAEELKNWDKNGTGTSFETKYPGMTALVKSFGLDPSEKPKTFDISLTEKTLNYRPRYSLKNLLEELSEYGKEGPPAPIY